MPSPLFKTALAAIQKQARREFGRTRAGRIIGEIQRLSKSRKGVRELKKKLEKLSQTGLVRNFQRTETGRAITEAAKLARGSEREQILKLIFNSFGPMGGLLKALIRPSGKALANLDKELKVAARFIESFGFTVTPDRRPAAQRHSNLVSQSRRILESYGFTVTPPPAAQRRRPPELERPKPQDIERKIGGRNRKYKPGDEILTGKMIPVSSSNVHSIGFLWNDDDPMNGTLQVRFLQSRGKGKATGGGPLYYYYRVHPDVFDAFRRAASKGEFVWDRLRIRGTVSGHRFAYDLKGITGGYVPRQAKRYGQNEYFVSRRVRGKSTRTGEVRTFESELEDRLVGRGERLRPGRGR